MRQKHAQEVRRKLIAAQRNELTEMHIYRRLAERTADAHNRKILGHIADDEERHCRLWRKLSGREIGPDWGKVRKYLLLARIFGVTFAVKLMEGREKRSQVDYEELSRHIPEARVIEREEKQHEARLIEMIKEKRLAYIGSIVLGLNDALVELTGALAGFTLALRNTRVIAMVGLITGIAASLSMAASEYLSQKTEKGGGEGGEGKLAHTAALYTGLAYISTVVLLILPFLLLENALAALAATLLLALMVIALFTYYAAVTKDLVFRRQFTEMAVLSLGVAAFSFLMGYLVRKIFGVDI